MIYLLIFLVFVLMYYCFSKKNLGYLESHINKNSKNSALFYKYNIDSSKDTIDCKAFDENVIIGKMVFYKWNLSNIYIPFYIGSDLYVNEKHRFTTVFTVFE